jgi:hypothetical protein
VKGTTWQFVQENVRPAKGVPGIAVGILKFLWVNWHG